MWLTLTGCFYYFEVLLNVYQSKYVGITMIWTIMKRTFDIILCVYASVLYDWVLSLVVEISIDLMNDCLSSNAEHSRYSGPGDLVAISQFHSQYVYYIPLCSTLTFPYLDTFGFICFLWLSSGTVFPLSLNCSSCGNVLWIVWVNSLKWDIWITGWDAACLICTKIIWKEDLL